MVLLDYYSLLSFSSLVLVIVTARNRVGTLVVRRALTHTEKIVLINDHSDNVRKVSFEG